MRAAHPAPGCSAPAALRAGPATWTLVQPHLYMQNLLRFAGSVQGNGRLSAPMADARFPLVDTRDVGAAVAAVLQDAIAHAGKCYRLTGPAACTALHPLSSINRRTLRL